MDKIHIQSLAIETHVGCLEWEQQVKQMLTLDITLFGDISAAAASDAVINTVDYAAVAEAVTTFVSGHHFQLIETVAEKTAQFILKTFAIKKLALVVHKRGAVANSAEVSVAIERESN